eukprot:COSAG06_NODE_46766_length_344_cov_0.844898_1_plen_40_part_01
MGRHHLLILMPVKALAPTLQRCIDILDLVAALVVAMLRTD